MTPRAGPRHVPAQPTECFTRNSRTTAIGGKRTLTATSGSRAWRNNRAIGVPTPKAPGPTVTRVGPGFLTSRSAGPPITTGVGFGFAELDGSGCRVNNGRRPGFHGGRTRIMSAGLRYLRKRASIGDRESRIGPIVITTSGLSNMHLFLRPNLDPNTSGARWFLPSATSQLWSTRET